MKKAKGEKVGPFRTTVRTQLNEDSRGLKATTKVEDFCRGKKESKSRGERKFTG